MLKTILDFVAAMIVRLGAPIFRTVGHWPGNYPRYLAQADRAGVHWRSTHYYQPTYRDVDLPRDVTIERDLPCVDLQPERQIEMLRAFAKQEKVGDGPVTSQSNTNNQYGPGDADALYAMVRHLKPGQIIEIGSGNSTKIATNALAANKIEHDEYRCKHICVEPYEMPWLETLGPEIIREKVENLPLDVFDRLEKNDVLFIDSSHVIRPFGDVLYEFQQIIPRLNSGVVIHVHDIFTPRDYPEKWLRNERRLWNEQYLLEVLLQNSSRYRTLLALNWLRHNHLSEFHEAFPNSQEFPDKEPGAFWFEVL